MTMLDDVGAYLVANTTVFTLGGTTGSLSIEQHLDSMPDTLVTLYEQAGLPNVYAMSTGTKVEVVWERPNLQAISRSTNPVTARSRIQTVYTLLDGLAASTLASSTIEYAEFVAVQAPFQLGKDDNDRHMWSLNFNVKKPVT